MVHGSVGADVEVRKGGTAPPAAPAVLEEHLAGQERRFPRQRVTTKVIGRDGIVEIFDAIEPNRDLGIDDGIDDERRGLGQFDQSARRPLEPRWILGQHVEDDVAVNEDVGACAFEITRHA